MTDIVPGTDVIRQALAARIRKGHAGPLARDLNVGIGALEGFSSRSGAEGGFVDRDDRRGACRPRLRFRRARTAIERNFAPNFSSLFGADGACSVTYARAPLAQARAERDA